MCTKLLNLVDNHCWQCYSRLMLLLQSLNRDLIIRSLGANNLIPVLFLGVNNEMFESLEKLLFFALLDVFKSISNFSEVYLSLLLDCSDYYDCSDYLDLKSIPLSNTLNTIFLFL